VWRASLGYPRLAPRAPRSSLGRFGVGALPGLTGANPAHCSASAEERSATAMPAAPATARAAATPATAAATTTPAGAAATAAAMHGSRPVFRIPFLVDRRLEITRQQCRSHARHLDLVRDVVLDVRQRHRVFLAAEADGVAL